MNYLLVFGCLAMAGIAVWTSAFFFKHPLSPFSVFYGVWFTALALYHMGGIAYIPVRGSTWLLVGLNLVAFGAGWLVPFFAWDSTAVTDPEFVRQQVSAERLRAIIVVCFILGAIGVAYLIRLVDSTLGLATYFNAPYMIRGAMAEGGYISEPLKPLNWLNVINVVLCSFYLFILRGSRKLMIWPILLFSLIAVLLMEDRTRFFYATIWAAFVLLHSMRLTGKKLLIGVVLGTAVLLAQFFMVGTWLGKVAENNPALMASANLEGPALLFLEPYMYVTASFPALQAYVDSEPVSTYGALTFYPAFRLMNMVDPTLERPAVVGEFFDIPSPANTFTWMYQFYTDFGIIGVLLGPWIIGLISAAVYFRMLRTRNLYSIYVNGLFSFCLALSIFVNHFTEGPAWYFLAVGILTAFWIKNPQLRSAAFYPGTEKGHAAPHYS